MLLLHQSPQHSGRLLPLIAALTDDARVVAPDMPGYGLSDGLPGEPRIEDFAATLAIWLEQLHIRPSIIFGVHTGALVALELALLIEPAHIVLDGLPLFDSDERADLAAHYFQDLAPQPDGSHLQRLWQRSYDQFRFFPWYAKDRPLLGRGNPDPAIVQSIIDDVILSAGECWKGYRAALAYPHAATRIADVRADTTLLYRPHDPLYDHRHRLPALPSRFEVTTEGDPLQHLQRAIGSLEPAQG